jgi:hypothetical protein
MKRTLALLALGALCAAQISRAADKYELKSDYARVDDTGTRSVTFQLTPEEKSILKTELKMRVTFIYKGKPGESEPSPLAGIMFVNTTRSFKFGHAGVDADWQYLNYHDFRCVIGEERFAFESKHDGKVGDPLLEFVTASVPLSFVKLLAASNDAECAVGTKTFKLDANAHEGLNALVGISVPPAK